MKMAERMKAWQCIGCGRIEAPQTCVGVCQDRKVEFVYAGEYEDALAQLEIARSQAREYEKLLRRLASATPREGEWKRSYCALQEQARRLLTTARRRDASDHSGSTGAGEAASSPAP